MRASTVLRDQVSAPRLSAWASTQERLIDVTLGQAGTPVGLLRFLKDGATECSAFTFNRSWLSNPRFFQPSPDLRDHGQTQWTKRSDARGSPFFVALTDTLPDGFGHSVLQRTFQDRMETGEEPRAPWPLCEIHDHCRLGALRLLPRDTPALELGHPIDLPTYVDLDAMHEMVQAFDLGIADQRQRRLLFHSATALGGSHPKVSFLTEDGMLTVAKFSRVSDEFPVVRAEMLASQLAKRAGIRVADMQLKRLRRGPALIVPRFDRDASGLRQPYLSARSLLLAEEGDEVGCHDLLKRMCVCCLDFASDARQLWSRVMFRRLLGSADPRLHKIGFIYSGRGRWKLAPAVGLRPGRLHTHPPADAGVREFGSSSDVTSLLKLAPAFELPQADAMGALALMVKAIERWRELASQFSLGMSSDQIHWMEGILSNEHLRQASELTGRRRQ